MTIRSMATASLHPTTDRRRSFLVYQSDEDYFPASEYASYEAFLNADGEPVKSEPRTRVVILRRGANGPQEESIRLFLKFTIILFCQESGPGCAFLRPSKSSTACVTSTDRVCRPPSRWLLGWSGLG